MPQTGEKKSEFGLIGLALVSAAALIGLAVDLVNATNIHN
ncbi:LPXTG cell wall anchor domain-containing protein [Lactobacillus amylolyticus]